MHAVYNNVFIKRIDYIIPGVNKELSGTRVLTSEIEERAMSAISRTPFKVPDNFIRFYTNVMERYFWKDDVRLEEECRKLLGRCRDEKVDFSKIKLPIYAALTKEIIEPSTMIRIMKGFPFPKEAMPFDISNACLGMANAVVMIANAVNSGQTEQGLAIGFEDSRQVTLDTLKDLQEHYTANKDKQHLRLNTPSLTLGSGALSIVVGSDGGMCKIKGYVSLSDASCADLCIGRRHKDKILIQTKAEKLERNGVMIVKESVRRAMELFGWSRVNFAVTHQVGRSHQRNAEENLRDICDNCSYTTFEKYGNMGTLSMPFTLAKAYEEGLIKKGGRALAIGFGSGLVSCVLGLEF
jgi:3-oxoacyl-[acyl-carrier-protein] synthase-3